MLAALGRLRGRALAGMILLAVLTPPLGAVLRPFVGPAVYCLLTLAFLRIDLSPAMDFLRRPGVTLAALAWTAVGLPLAIVAGVRMSGLGGPGLEQAVALQALAAPLMAGPAFALLLGLNASLVLLLLVLGTAVVPFSAPLVAAVLDVPLGLSPQRLAASLAMLLAGAALLGVGARHLLGEARLARHYDRIDGVNMVVMFVFVSAVMGDLIPRLLAEPLRFLALTALAFGLFWTIFGLTRLLFAGFGPVTAASVALTVANRNMGLLVAATGAQLAPDGWLYFAVVQFPIYLTPLMLARWAQKP